MADEKNPDEAAKREEWTKQQDDADYGKDGDK